MVDISGPQSENTPGRDERPSGGSVSPSVLGLGALAGNARLAEVLQSQVQAQVGALADLDENNLPLPGRVQEAQREAQESAPEARVLGAAPAPVQEFFQAQVENRQALNNEVQELQAGEAGPEGPDEQERPPLARQQGQRDLGPPALERQGAQVGIGQAQAPAAAPKGRWQRFKEGASAVGGAVAGFFAAAWKGIKSLGSKEGRHDAGRGTNTVLSTGNSLALGASLAPSTTGQGLQDLGSAMSGHGLTGAGQSVGDTSSSVSNAGSAALEITHTVTSVVGIFFSALKAALDTKSLISSIRVHRSLKKARERALRGRHDPKVVEAVEYAIKQKYTKILRRAAGAVLAFAALGTSLAILISNPAGAAIAAVIIGGIGVVWAIWKIYHLIKKWSERGKKRNEMARLLYERAKADDRLALNALTALGLNVRQVKGSNDDDGPALIARKLKST